MRELERPAPAAELDAALARAERLGHRFAAPPATAAPAAGEPIQRVFDVDAFKRSLAERDHDGALQHVDGATPNELRILHADPEISHADLGELYGRAARPASKLHLWSAFHAKSARAQVAARDLPAKPGVLQAGIFEDVRSSAAHLAAQHAGSAASDDLKRQDVGQLDADRRRAREVELEHGVSIRPTQPQGAGLEADQGEFRAFSQPELGDLGGILGRLPAAHVAGNENLHFIRRRQRGPRPDLGALYKSGESGLEIYDQPAGVHYRATGEESYLGEHDEQHPVTPLDEVATHEIGHAVERQHPGAFARIKAAAGWSEYRNADDAKAALSAHGMGWLSRRSAIADLEASRNASFHEQRPVVHNGYEYRAHPDKAGQFMRRRLSFMPGDAATPESAGRSHVDYAKTSPNEHFAELYAQMVHVPERTYADYVEGPKARLDAAQQVHSASMDAYVEAVETHGKTSPAAREARRRMDAHERAVAERREQHQALGKQWDVMREEVFGVDQQAVDAHEASIRLQARERDLDEEEAVKHFQLHARKAATPRQLRRLGERALVQAPPRPQPLVDAQPVALGGGGEGEDEED